MSRFEVLSPVGNGEMLTAACRAGADAVYLPGVKTRDHYGFVNGWIECYGENHTVLLNAS